MTRTQTIGGTVAVLVAVLLGLALSIDAVARSVLESTLSRAVGTEATVESLDLEVLSGRVTLEGLALANPEGFEGPRFLSLRRGRLGAGLANVFRDTVAVRELTLEGVELDLEQRGGRSNVGPILASVEEARGARGESDEIAYRIEELVIRDVTARVRIGAGPAGEPAATVRIPEIRMENVGSGGSGAVTLSELAGLTLQAVLGAVARESGDLPGRLGGLLRGQLEPLPGGVDLQLPEGADTEGLQEQAEEELRKLVPGQDDGS